MKKITLFALLLVSACSGNPLAGGKTIVSVNGTNITEQNLNFLGTINPNIARQLNSPIGKKQIIDNLIEQELLYQAAKKESLQRDKTVQSKIKLYQKVILAQSLIEQEADRVAKAEYDASPQKFERLRMGMIEIVFANPEAAVKTETKTAQDKIRSEKVAKELADQAYQVAHGGTSFAEVAAQFTDDVRGKKNGGDQGFVTRDEAHMIRRGLKELLDKAFQMKVGEIAEPLKIGNSFYLLTVTAPMEHIPFEQAKEQLLYRLHGETRNRLLGELKTKARIKYAEEYAPQQEDVGKIAPSSIAPTQEPPHSHPHPEGKEASQPH